MTSAARPIDLLATWFRDVSELLDAAVFRSAAAEGPHRNAVMLSLLGYHARRLRNAPLDQQGALYNSVAFILVAASRSLATTLGPDRWSAAIDNVVTLDRALAERSHELAANGVSAGGAADIFKNLLDEALADAGTAGEPTTLDQDGRQLALGLAVNWGMRFLVAYSLHCHPRAAQNEPNQGKRGLAWIAALVEARPPENHAEAP